MLDQRFALEWVQENIWAFGGDASNVAIAGESSGGTCVAFHLTASVRTPTKLFHKAILQSPGITQIKSWEDATLNTEYIVSALTAMSSPDCMRSQGYASFNDTLLEADARSGMVRITTNDTVDSAMQWCDRNATCKGFMWNPTLNQTTFVGYVPHVKAQLGVRGFLKRGPVEAEARTRCLVSADAWLLTNLSCRWTPRGDTFFVDHWGPTIDGVYLNETLVRKVANGAVADGVDVLVGSNLDEGTEFISLLPIFRAMRTTWS